MALLLEFTPLEFETSSRKNQLVSALIIRIYSVGVWNVGVIVYAKDSNDKLEFTPLEFETALLG